MIELQDYAAKRSSGRRIPIHPDPRRALAAWRAVTTGDGSVIRSERGGSMTPVSIVNWFALAYRSLGLHGCSSHPGRRTFIARAAKAVPTATGAANPVSMLLRSCALFARSQDPRTCWHSAMRCSDWRQP